MYAPCYRLCTVSHVPPHTPLSPQEVTLPGGVLSIDHWLCCPLDYSQPRGQGPDRPHQVTPPSCSSNILLLAHSPRSPFLRLFRLSGAALCRKQRRDGAIVSANMPLLLLFFPRWFSSGRWCAPAIVASCCPAFYTCRAGRALRRPLPQARPQAGRNER